jgi:hypothetical protein
MPGPVHEFGVGGPLVPQHSAVEMDGHTGRVPGSRHRAPPRARRTRRARRTEDAGRVFRVRDPPGPYCRTDGPNRARAEEHVSRTSANRRRPWWSST